MWSLVTTRGQRVALRDLPAVLGRERGVADVALPHPSLAPRHARLEADGDGLLIEALDDAPLEIDGWPVAGGRLAHGDDLVLGELVLRVEDDARGEVDPPTARAPTARPGTASTSTSPTGASASAGVRRPLATDAAADDLVLRKPAPARGAGAGSSGASASGALRRSSGGETLTARAKGPLRSRRADEKDGLLHVDLGQVHPLARAGLVLGMLAVFALVAWGIGLAVGAVG